jgi:hypothetical protein
MAQLARVRYEVLRALIMKSAIFWNVSPHSLVELYRRFIQIQHTHLPSVPFKINQSISNIRADEYTPSGQQYEHTHWVDQDRTVARNRYFRPTYLHTKLHYDSNVICTAKHTLVYFARTTIFSLTSDTDLTIQRHMREVSLVSLPHQTLVQKAALILLM